MDTSPSNSLLVPLEKPPQALALTVRKLIQKVHAGEVRVPPFQRPLRWKGSDVEKLFDSILKGYPIGSLLFWKQGLPADDDFRLGNARLSVPEVKDGWYIVDGQQRTTALAAALLELEHGADTRWVVRFDPSTNTFHSGVPSSDERVRQVPLTALGDLRRLGRWLRDCELDEALQAHVETVQQRVLDYELPAYIMDTDNPEGLKGAFARLNSTGVRMRPDEVFQALLGTHARAKGPLDLDEIQAACDLDGFGQPPRHEVLKAVLAMSGIDPTRRLEDLGESAPSQLVSISESIEALQAAVAFLQAAPEALEPGAGIPAYAFIPYPVVFVLLARWFYLFPNTDAVTRQALSHWLWRAVATGVHNRAAVSGMRLQVRLMQPDNLEGSLKGLIGYAKAPDHIDWSLSPFHANHAASRVELLALLARGPRDLTGLVSWRALLSDGQRVAREILASAAWTNLDESSRELARTAANRALLDARHTGLRAEFKLWRFDENQETLESHLIDRPAFEALVQGKEEQFLRHRASLVRAEVSSFMTKRAGLGEPLLRPTETYFDPAQLPIDS